MVGMRQVGLSTDIVEEFLYVEDRILLDVHFSRLVRGANQISGTTSTQSGNHIQQFADCEDAGAFAQHPTLMVQLHDRMTVHHVDIHSFASLASEIARHPSRPRVPYAP